MKFLLVLLVLSVGPMALGQDDALFEEISPEVSDMPDAIGGSNDDIGTPDPLDGSNSMDAPIFGDDEVQLDLDGPDQSADALNEDGIGSGEIQDSGDLSLPSDSVESQNLNIPLGPVRAPTQPNYDKERFFNKVYREYNQKPIEPGEWKQLSQERRGEAYAVQGGDTLWDISTTFFGEGGYWPKVWSLNQNITNPHKIEPEQRLIFYPGNLDEEPSMELDEAAKEQQELKKQLPKSVQIPDGLEIPPPRAKPNKVIGIPESLPFLRTFTIEKPDFSAPAIGAPIDRIATNRTEVTTYFDEQLPASVGQIVEAEFGGTSAAQYQYVYVQAASPPPSEVAVYNVVETFYDEEDDEKAIGYIIEIQGTLGQPQVVNSSQNIYRMMVTRSIYPVTVGAQLFTGGIQTISTNKDRAPKAIAGQVFGGRFEKNRRYFGTGGVVFINAGAGAGVAVGDIIQIVANPQSRHDEQFEVENFRSIASVKAIYVSGGVTTALVLDATEAIRTGDYSGQAVASMFPSSSGGDESEDFDDEGTSSFEEFEGAQEDGFDDFGGGEDSGDDDFGGFDDTDGAGDDDFGDDSEEDYEEF